MKTLKQQADILRKSFGITISVAKPPKLIAAADGLFVIPKWSKLAPTYGEALQKVFDAIKKERPFYNWREGQLGPENLRELPHKNVPEIISVQLGKKWKGKSVDTVRKEKASGEILLGAYEVAIILLTNPDILKSSDDLFLDCAGDEASPGADGDFSRAPSFFWGDGELGFGFFWTDDAYDSFGTVSGFLSQPLENRPLESFAPLTLEAAIERVKEEGYVIYKPV